MIVLGLDCAGAACSAALLSDGVCLAAKSEEMSRGQAERIVPMIREVLETAALGVQDLDGIAVTVGPGAFTGVRIGIAAAQGLARTANCPAMGVTVTEALAMAVPVAPGKTVLAAIDSRRADPFCEVFLSSKNAWLGQGPELLAEGFVSLPARYALEEADWSLVGDLAESAGAVLSGGMIVENSRCADPANVARLGERQLREGRCQPAVPLYLRGPDVSAPSRDRARRPARI